MAPVSPEASLPPIGSEAGGRALGVNQLLARFLGLSPLGSEVGEMNMGDVRILADFLALARVSAFAEAGARGVGSDVALARFRRTFAGPIFAVEGA